MKTMGNVAMAGEFSEEVRVALAAAKGRAKSQGSESCGLRPLLITLLENLDELSFQSMESLGINPEDLAGKLHDAGAAGRMRSSELPLDSNSKLAIEFARRECGGNKLYPSHLLLGVLKAAENFRDDSAELLPPGMEYQPLKQAMDRITEGLSKTVERLSWEAVNSLYYARRIAVDSRNLKIGLAHLLAGCLMEPSNAALAVFSNLELDLGSIMEKSLESASDGSREWRSITRPVIGREGLEALTLAGAEAQGMEFKRYGSCHIILGIFRANEKSGGLPFLSGLGLDVAKLRWAVLKMANWTHKQDSELEKFGPDSIMALSRAARVAREFGSGHVHIEHIALGLLEDPTNKACNALDVHGADIAAITAMIHSATKRKKSPAEKRDIVALTEVARKALDLAKLEAQSLGRGNVGSDCILLGLLAIEEGAMIFKGGGLDYQTVKKAILQAPRR